MRVLSRLRCPLRCRRFLLAVAIVLVWLRFADAQVAVDVVHGFPSIGAVQPGAPLLLASDGKLYGTTQFGGAHNAGTVFSLAPDGTFTVLHEFDRLNGAAPNALIQAGDGYLYGTTTGGGLGFGTAFRISLDGSFTILHLFDNVEGGAPSALIQGTDGLFYGTAASSANFAGTVFRMTPGGAVTTLHEFSGGGNDRQPRSGLVEGGDGSFYGMTDFGGFGSNCGTVFRITAAGAFEITHRFGFFFLECNQVDTPMGPLILGPGGLILGATGLSVFAVYNGTFIPLLDAAPPQTGIFGPLTFGADGSLYSTIGTFVIKLGPGGVSLLHAFTDAEGTALNPLIQAPDGHLYGTAHTGGAFGLGTVFKMTTSGEVTVLHDFSAGTPCTAALMLTYAAGTLNLGFSLGSATPATFSTWLVHESGVFNLWSVPVPAIAPAVSFDLPIAGFPSIGNVGVLTVLNAPSWSGACYDWQVVDTGGTGASAEALRNQITREGLVPTAQR